LRSTAEAVGSADDAIQIGESAQCPETAESVFVGLWATGVELNITAMMGMVVIMGIATEMAIFLVSEYQALAREMLARQAIRKAALNRLRPITMSTLAMILALLPLGAAISGSGDQMLQPLAIAIIAGIVVQLPLVLLAMPVVIGLTIASERRGGSCSRQR
jgi:multidrug efflux pump subunit AcrB